MCVGGIRKRCVVVLFPKGQSVLQHAHTGTGRIEQRSSIQQLLAPIHTLLLLLLLAGCK